MERQHGVFKCSRALFPTYSFGFLLSWQAPATAFCRYATSADSHAVFAQLCTEQAIPFQKFVTRSDMGCGSTIGPITAAKLGISTIDVGLPTFAMHSIRETAGAEDAQHLVRALTEFLSLASAPVSLPIA
jgi:aspartyl aminopeptidase